MVAAGAILGGLWLSGHAAAGWSVPVLPELAAPRTLSDALPRPVRGPGGSTGGEAGATAGTAGGANGGGESLLGDLAWLPVDVELILAVEGADALMRGSLGALVRDLAGRDAPMAATREAWEGLARQMRMQPSVAFDAMLAERVVFALRTRPAGTENAPAAGSRRAATRDAPAQETQGTVEWVALTLVDRSMARRLTQTLGAAPRSVQHGRPAMALEGGAFVLDVAPAIEPGRVWVAIGPSDATGLFELARRDGPGARPTATGLRERVLQLAGGGTLGDDPSFVPILALARSFSAQPQPPVDPVRRAVAEAAGEPDLARFFVYDARRRGAAPTPGERGDWLACVGQAVDSTIRVGTLRRMAAMEAREDALPLWTAAPFERLPADALAAGVMAGALLASERDLSEAGSVAPASGGLGDGGLVDRVVALLSGEPRGVTPQWVGSIGGVAEQLGLPSTRMAWTIHERRGRLDAALAVETLAVAGLAAQGDAFMRSVLVPMVGGEPEVRRGLAAGAGVTDHSMRVVRRPENAEGWSAFLPFDAVAWTYRVDPVASRASSKGPSAWWTVGGSPALVAAMADGLTTEPDGTAQRWLSFQSIRPRVYAAALQRAGFGDWATLERMQRIERLDARQAMLPGGLILGQVRIEVAREATLAPHSTANPVLAAPQKPSRGGTRLPR
jgi:hypothetical protein